DRFGERFDPRGGKLGEVLGPRRFRRLAVGAEPVVQPALGVDARLDDAVPMMMLDQLDAAEGAPKLDPFRDPEEVDARSVAPAGRYPRRRQPAAPGDELRMCGPAPGLVRVEVIADNAGRKAEADVAVEILDDPTLDVGVGR